MAQLSRFVFGLIPALALALGAAGCVTEISTGGGEGEGGGGEGGGGEGGEGGEGGGEVCEAYTGVGCTPGEQELCNVCIVEGCETKWYHIEDCNTPLVLSFDGAAVEFASDATRAFDVNGAASQVTDWPTARTPWLALDRDRSGAIEDGRELFGSMTPLAAGGTGTNGVVSLRELDANGDGRINAEDPAFAELVVWSDKDADRVSSSGELASVAAWRLVSIDLDYVVVPRCDARGNCEGERASFQYHDAVGILRTGTVIDVRLPAQR
ncbi:calcium-binding protein [Polyangium sp. y55x31]|uniref:calcium-binding protein n=1 Tax=Polyangium sp. y55x31 TaxID=3042688 RepID=UPI0024825206|nr:calcium-binding protein [Polyangium sp. y55x31]MDI1480137.1 calcium-binding protein [Polyangium sp. y55x31]